MIDLTWVNPTEEQEVALEIAVKQKSPGLTEFQIAEFICMAKESLWFIQAKRWSENPPTNVPPTWKLANQVISQLVESGYNREKQTWWDMTTLDKKTLITELLLLADFGIMLKQYCRQSPEIISSGFSVFLNIVLGQDWEKRFTRSLNREPGG